MSLDGLSMSPLAAELNAALAGGRVDKIFQPNKNSTILWIRQPGATFRLHINIDAAQPCIYLSKQQPDNPAVPPVFCMVLRKHLEDGRIAGIAQQNVDRILHIDIDLRGPQSAIITKTLVVELMGKHSNVILLENGKIIDAMRRIGDASSRTRPVIPGNPYLPPPHQDKVNMLQTAPAELIQQLQAAHTGPLAKALVRMAQGMGPLTANELIWRAGLPAAALVEDLTEPQQTALTQAVADIIRALTETDAKQPSVAIDGTGRLLGIAAFEPQHLTSKGAINRLFSSLSAALAYAGSLTVKYTPPEKPQLVKLIAGELAKLEKKRSVLQDEYAAAAAAGEYRKHGDILMANLHRQPNGLTKIELNDLYSEQPESDTVCIAIDPLLTMLDNARSYYSKYNKLKRAQTSLTHQLDQTNQELAYLATIETALDNAANNNEVTDIRRELAAAGYIRQTKQHRMPTQQSRPLKLTAADGTEILIGKNNFQNDEITFKHARPDDLWLHTKDFPGSHVIIRTTGQPPSDSTLALAAQLAAYFSKARASAKVPVDYTKRRYVKKPAGSKPGFVIYTSQKTLYITPDGKAIEDLLNT